MKNRKFTGIKSLAIALSVAMLCTISAFAVEYTSSTVPYSAGNDTYNVWSSLYMDGGTKCRAGTWIRVNGDVIVPAYYMGVSGRLYAQSGEMLKDTFMKYNSTPEYYNFITTDQASHSGLVYSLGKISLYTGTSYVQYDAPQTVYAQAGANAVLRTTVQSLEKTLDHGAYPVNENGQTYGSGLLAEVVGEEPELISAVGVNDVRGYVRADDLTPDVSNPAEAAAYMATWKENATIPLYNVNGGVIGAFELSSFDLQGSENMSLEETQTAVENAGYPQNSKGETYGNALMAQKLGYESDLIAAIGTEGQFGYVRNTELNPCITSLEEAAESMKNYSSCLLIPLYDQEGNVIGSFELSDGTASGMSSFDRIENAQSAVEAMGSR